MMLLPKLTGYQFLAVLLAGTLAVILVVCWVAVAVFVDAWWLLGLLTVPPIVWRQYRKDLASAPGDILKYVLRRAEREDVNSIWAATAVGTAMTHPRYRVEAMNRWMTSLGPYADRTDVLARLDDAPPEALPVLRAILFPQAPEEGSR